MGGMVSPLLQIDGSEPGRWLALGAVILLGLVIYVLLVVIRMSHGRSNDRWSRILRKPTRYHPENDPWREASHRVKQDDEEDDAQP